LSPVEIVKALPVAAAAAPIAAATSR